MFEVDPQIESNSWLPSNNVAPLPQNVINIQLWTRSYKKTLKSSVAILCWNLINESSLWLVWGIGSIYFQHSVALPNFFVRLGSGLQDYLVWWLGTMGLHQSPVGFTGPGLTLGKNYSKRVILNKICHLLFLKDCAGRGQTRDHLVFIYFLALAVP